jgi:hypothetical protein
VTAGRPQEECIRALPSDTRSWRPASFCGNPGSDFKGWAEGRLHPFCFARQEKRGAALSSRLGSCKRGRAEDGQGAIPHRRMGRPDSPRAAAHPAAEAPATCNSSCTATEIVRIDAFGGLLMSGPPAPRCSQRRSRGVTS